MASHLLKASWRAFYNDQNHDFRFSFCNSHATDYATCNIQRAQRNNVHVIDSTATSI